MAEFKDSYITEEERKALLIQNLADRPNAMNSYGRAKMSAEDIKKAFDDQFILVVDRHNLLHESVEEIRGEAQTERLESLENRTGALEGRADTLDTRADALEGRADTVEGRLGDQNAANSIEDVIQRVADLESLLDDPDKQDTLNESYQGVRDRVKKNENDISKNADAITENTNAISENTNAISENNANIVGHEGRLESLEIAMGDLYNKIITNTQNIQKNDDQIGYINNYLRRSPSESENIFLDAYPIGSIYMSVNPTSPANLFGGGWTQLKNQFLVGAGGTYSVKSGGGTTSHSHGAGTLGAGATYTSNPATIILETKQSQEINYKPTAKMSVSSKSDYSQITDWIVPVYGSTASEDYLPPYYAVYMWRRDA